MEIVRAGLGAKELAGQALRDLESDVRAAVVASVISPGGGGQLRNVEMQTRMQRIRTGIVSLKRAGNCDERELEKLEVLHQIGVSPQVRNREERDYYDEVVSRVPAAVLTLGVGGRGQFTHEGYIRVTNNVYSRLGLDFKSQPVRCGCEAAGHESCTEETCSNASMRRECPSGSHSRDWLIANGGCGNCRLDKKGGKPSVRVLRTRRTGRGAFTDVDIVEGTLVVKCVGEVVSAAVKDGGVHTGFRAEAGGMEAMEKGKDGCPSARVGGANGRD